MLLTNRNENKHDEQAKQWRSELPVDLQCSYVWKSTFKKLLCHRVASRNRRSQVRRFVWFVILSANWTNFDQVHCATNTLLTGFLKYRPFFGCTRLFRPHTKAKFLCLQTKKKQQKTMRCLVDHCVSLIIRWLSSLQLKIKLLLLFLLRFWRFTVRFSSIET